MRGRGWFMDGVRGIARGGRMYVLGGGWLGQQRQYQ